MIRSTDVNNDGLGDMCREALRVVHTTEEAGLSFRLTGGVAVALRCPSAASPVLSRAYADIDGVVRRKDRRELGEVLHTLGYDADRNFNALHGEIRLLFRDRTTGRQVDVFVDRIEMCHSIDLRTRLVLDDVTVTLADLLLMKLQIVETNRKDILDILALLVDQDFSPDESGINLEYIGRLASRDWGLWRTTTMIADRSLQFANGLIGFEARTRIQDQVERYRRTLEGVPKSPPWRLRARIGDRRLWYELPEEVH